MPLEPRPISTARLLLVPVSDELARSVLLSDLTAFRACARRHARRPAHEPRRRSCRGLVRHVGGLSRLLLAQDGVRRVVAHGVARGNAASRRALERAGFVLERSGEEGESWALGPPLEPGPAGRPVR